MSGFFTFGGGGAARNPQRSYEQYGFNGADTGRGTTLLQGASNTKGSFTTIGTATAALAGLTIYSGHPGASNLRTLLDVSIDGGSTTIISNLFQWLTDTGGFQQVTIPVKI